MILLLPPIPLINRQFEINFGADLSAQIIETYNSILKFINNFDFQTLIADLKLAAIALSIILGTILVVILIKMGDLAKGKVAELKSEISPPAKATTAYNNRWQEIKTHVNSFKESDWKLAVIEADKLVDEILKTAGFKGETMGERLTLISSEQLSGIQDLWDGHKLRNLLVHDISYQVTHRQAILAVEAFEKVLHELEAI